MTHRNARTTVRVRIELCRMIEAGAPVARAAACCGTSRQTAYKWLGRWREGDRELLDRSSRPRHMPRLVEPELAEFVVRARKATGYGPCRLGGELGIPGSTVWKILRRAGCNRHPKPEREPVRRYERGMPGELIHVDIKKLGRFAQPGHRAHGDRSNWHRDRGIGWEFFHVAVDDRTRLAYVEQADNERKEACAGFLERACDWFATNGINVERVLTDNGSGYRSNNWRDVCHNRGIKHKRTRPYRPQTNGKAERFIQTLMREWAYAGTFTSSSERAKTLARWCDTYNTRRYHTAIKTTPWQRAASDLAVNNVRGHYS